MGAVIAAGIGAGISAVSSISASGKARRAAKKEKRLQRLMTAEELKRLEKEQAQVLGSARAQVAASGFTGYGANTQQYLSELQEEQAEQRKFTATVGAERASAISRRGEAMASSYKMDAYSSLVKGFGSVAQGFNWGLDETT